MNDSRSQLLLGGVSPSYEHRHEYRYSSRRPSKLIDTCNRNLLVALPGNQHWEQNRPCLAPILTCRLAAFAAVPQTDWVPGPWAVEPERAQVAVMRVQAAFAAVLTRTD